MDIEKLLKDRKVLIDAKLNELLPRAGMTPKPLHEAMRYSVFSGGKRIRPALAIEACLCCGGRVSDCVDAACAIELIHTFSLIHDDLPAMDDDDYRRGKPACHKKFGEATAILAGDALLAFAFEVLTGAKNKMACSDLVKTLSRAIGSLGVAGGQCVDMEYAGKKKHKVIINYINRHKTAALISASLKMGAISSGAADKKIAIMERFGGNIGEAFQLIDDILDNGPSVRVFGRDKLIRRAGLLTINAKHDLAPFGKLAGILKAIADYLIERRI
ncbi:MAG: polyprenyl synthetase family protein [Candidatus Omnitrophica bacterium]|nr:polyprenyl synthetase family protein [Candidatus Omnitrophota bacterium]